MSWFDELDEGRRTRLLEALKTTSHGREASKHAGDNEGFACWLLVCDAIMVRRLGLGIWDLPDQTWRDWYDDELKPGEALTLALDNEI